MLHQPLRAIALALLVSLAGPASARAKEPIAPPPAFGASLPSLERERREARAMKISGAALTAIGAAAAVVTVLLAIVAARQCDAPRVDECDAGARLARFGLGLGAATHLAIGIPLLGVGAHRERDALARLSVAVTPIAAASSLSGGAIRLALEF